MVTERKSLLERFPVLARLDERRGRRRVPIVQQLSMTECGAACLTMVLGYYGKSARLDEVRTVMGVGRDGANALAILDTGNRYGLIGRGVHVELDDLDILPTGAILHWDFNHFVVFERMRGDVIEIVDPASGRRKVSREQMDRSFTGVALLLEPSTTFVKSEAGKRPIWAQMRAAIAESGQWSRILTVSVLLQLLALAMPVLTGAVVDRVVPRGDMHLLWILGAGIAGLLVFTTLASLIRAHLLIHLRTIFDARMTLGFVDHMLRLPYAYFQTRSAGDLMMRINSNATIREIVTSGLLSTLLDGALTGIYLILLFIADAPFALLVVALGLVQGVVFWYTRERQRELLSETLHTQARSESYLVEMLSGMETLKSTGAELRAGEHWAGLFVDQLNVSLDRARLGAGIDTINGVMRTASPLIILGFGATQALAGQMTIGTVLAMCALAGAFLTPLSNLVATATQLQLVGRYLERIEDVLDAQPEQPIEEPRSVPLLRGGIALDHVSFAYTSASPTVVRDVSLEVKPGQFVAIVGRSGSGKSTLANLLLGLYPPTSGNIRYDGVDLGQLDVRSLRQQVGIVNQRAHLFATSIRANIAMSEPDLPIDRIEQAAQLAALHDDVLQMPMGYDTLLLDAGASLSGGQRQRVSLARALVRQPAILLLDEATSALDAVTERAVEQNLATLRCTRVVIAHRLSTIRMADVILVMDDGRIVERGTHAQLLMMGGAYARLIAAQMEG